MDNVTQPMNEAIQPEKPKKKASRVKKKAKAKKKKAKVAPSTRYRKMVSVRLRHGAIAMLYELIDRGKRHVHEKTSSSDIIEAGLIALKLAPRTDFVRYCLHEVNYLTQIDQTSLEDGAED